MNCRAVVGEANNQLADPGDAESLLSRVILYAPDYVVNVGGALAATGIKMGGWSPEEAQEQVNNNVRSTLLRIFKMSAEETVTTEAAANKLALINLSKSG